MYVLTRDYIDRRAYIILYPINPTAYIISGADITHQYRSYTDCTRCHCAAFRMLRQLLNTSSKRCGHIG